MQPGATPCNRLRHLRKRTHRIRPTAATAAQTAIVIALSRDPNARTQMERPRRVQRHATWCNRMRRHATLRGVVQNEPTASPGVTPRLGKTNPLPSQPLVAPRLTEIHARRCNLIPLTL